MPIKQLQTDDPGLPRAGVIRLGYKVKKCQHCNRVSKAKFDACQNCGKSIKDRPSYPVEANHFVLDDAPGVAEAVKETEPVELKIFFPFDDPNLVFPNFMQFWQASSLVCRGDGEQILYAIETSTGRVKVRDGIALNDFIEGREEIKAGQVMPCPGPDRDRYPKCQNCKPNAMLIVLLRDVPRLAYWQISTTSIHNIVDLTKQLNMIQATIAHLTGAPRLTGVPFILKRVKRTVSVPGGKDGKRQRVEKWFIQLEIEPEWVMRMMTAQRRLADPMARFALGPGAQPAQPAIDVLEPEPTTPKAAGGFADPPQWDPYPAEEAEGAWWEEQEEPVQPEPQPAPVQPSAPAANGGNGGNGHKLTRPMSPEQVKNAAVVKSAKSTKPAGETQLDYAATSLSKATGSDDKKRHAVTEYLFGFSSLKNATSGQCSFIIDWIGAKKENEYEPLPEAIKEIEAIWRQVQVDAGQVDMFDDQPNLDDVFPREPKEIDF